MAMTSRTLQVDGWSWRLVVSSDPAELLAMGAELHLDPYIVDDLLDVEQLPKVEETDGAVFVVLHALRGSGDVLDTVDSYFVVTDKELLTVCSESVPAVEHLWNLVEREPRHATRPIEAIARFLDVTAQRFLAAAAAIEGEAVRLQERAVVGDATVLPAVLTLRNEETAVRRILGPQATATMILAGGGLVAQHPAAARRLRDAVASTERAAAEFSYARSLLGDVLDVYRGAVAEKTNQVTRVLTAYAAIVLPLSIVVGFWGMNFADLPLIDETGGWWFVLGGMAVIAVGSWIFFLQHGFIGGTLRDLPKQLGRGVVSVARAPIRLTRSWGPDGG